MTLRIAVHCISLVLAACKAEVDVVLLQHTSAMSKSKQPPMWDFQRPVALLGPPLYPQPQAAQGSPLLQLPQAVQGSSLLQVQGGTSIQSMDWVVSTLQAEVRKEREDSAQTLAASQHTIDKVSSLAQAASDQLQAQLDVSTRALSLSRDELAEARQQLHELRASNASAHEMLQKARLRQEEVAARDSDLKEAAEAEVRRARAEAAAEIRSVREEAVGALHQAHLEAQGAVRAAEEGAREQVAVVKQEAAQEVESSRESVALAQRMMQSWTPAEVPLVRAAQHHH